MSENTTDTSRSDVVDSDLKEEKEGIALTFPENTEEPKGDELEGEVKTDGDVQSDSLVVADGDADGTAPDLADALEGRNAFKAREEKRRRIAVEEELASVKAKLNTPTKEKPVRPDYESYESDAEYNTDMAKYTEDLTDWKLDQREAVKLETRKQNAHFESMRELDRVFNDKSDKFAETHPDYDDKIANLQNTPAMEEAIKRSENSAEVAYHLAGNQELTNRLLNSSPAVVGMEIQNLDLRIKAGLKTKKSSTAPNPINPVGSKGDGDITGEVDTSKMTDDEYHVWWKKDQIKQRKLA